MEIIRCPEAIGWKVTAQITGGGPDHEVVLSAEPNQPRLTQIDGKTAAQTALARLLRIIWLVPAQDRLWIEGADGRRRFLDRIALSFFPEHAEAVLSYEKAMRERNRLLKDGVQDARWYGALEGQMADAGARLTAHRRDAIARIIAAQEGAVTAFPAAALALEMDDLATPPDFAAALSESRSRVMAAGRSLIGPHRADLAVRHLPKDMPAASCSTGEQKALLIGLVLAHARLGAAESGQVPLLLLDEIAAHLDSARRAALFDILLGLGGQVWMSGTDRALFAPLDGAAAFYVVADGTVAPA